MKTFRIVDLRDKNLGSLCKFAVLNEDTEQLVVYYGLAAFKDWNHLINMVMHAFKHGSHFDEIIALNQAKPDWLV